MDTIKVEDIRQMIENSVTQKVDAKLSMISQDIKDIKEVILGNKEFSIAGIKGQHDEMYEAYKQCKINDQQTKVEILWKSYERTKWLFATLGISSVAGLMSLVLTIYNIIKYANVM